jgi:cysteinyl-tRNA synthetase
MKYFYYYIFVVLIFSSCKIIDRSEVYDDVNFKREMRNFVIGISQYSKAYNPDFAVIPQNGAALILEEAQTFGNVETEYLNAIDGQAQEGLNFGYSYDDVRTQIDIKSSLQAFLDSANHHHKTILVTDYCITPSNIDESFQANHQKDYLGFVATRRSLDRIPNYSVRQENRADINSLANAKNFLYLLNYDNYNTKTELITAVSQTNYDLLIIDAFFNDGTAFTNAEIQLLKHKANGGLRQVIAYMSIGEAENYRYYWKTDWNTNVPAWMEQENPNWHGNYKVKYWMKDWQNIIYGNDNSYVKKIINQGFDGVYLDIIDAYEYFEEKFN